MAAHNLFGKYCQVINKICEERAGCENCLAYKVNFSPVRNEKPTFPCPYNEREICRAVPGCNNCELAPVKS